MPRICLLILEKKREEWGREGERGVGERERESESERNSDVRQKHLLVASCIIPNVGLNLQPREVP